MRFWRRLASAVERNRFGDAPWVVTGQVAIRKRWFGVGMIIVEERRLMFLPITPGSRERSWQTVTRWRKAKQE